MKRARHRLNLPRSRIMLLVVAAGAVLVLVISVFAAQMNQQSAEDQTAEVTGQRDATAAQAQSLATQIQAACRDGSLQGALCERADQVAADPVPGPTGPIGPTGEAGPPPSPEQIQHAVDAYLVANPPPGGREPTAAEVAAAVASYLSANPPSPGRAPSAAEISAAVEVYFANNPPPEGEPGRPPTAEEIRAAVDDYLASNPPPAGPAGVAGERGDPGPRGVGIEDVELELGTCQLVFTLDDGTERTVSLPSDVCDPPTSPTGEPPGPLDE